MRTDIFQGLRRAARLRNPFASLGLVLMYHRIIDVPSDPQLLGVTPQHFAEHLQVLNKYAHPLRPLDLAKALRERKLPRRAVAMTFDDGYADNLYNAKPLLERYDVPASIFVTTGHIGHEHEFWWDELDKLLLQPGTLLPTVELRLDGRTWQWELGETATYTNADYDCYRDWHVERQDDPTPRQHLYRSVYQVLHAVSEREREQLLQQVRVWTSTQPGGPTHRTLSPDELVHLGAGDLVEIGAHTMTHSLLAALPVAAQRQEIQHSKADLEAILNRPVTGFAYPHGSYTQETLAIIREVGFTYACSSDTALVQQSSDGFRLPRVAVRDWDGEAFARWLRGWLGG